MYIWIMTLFFPFICTIFAMLINIVFFYNINYLLMIIAIGTIIQVIYYSILWYILIKSSPWP